MTAYALTFGGFLLLGGRAADLLGRRRLFMTGLVIFAGASLACALATSDTFLIEGAERNKALGLWGGIGASGATIGLLAGPQAGRGTRPTAVS